MMLDLKVELKAASRLLASPTEAGLALKAIQKVLHTYSFVTHQYGDEQATVWRSSLFKAALILNIEDDTLAFRFSDKGYTAAFEAEGYSADTLLKDIRFNVTQFKPSKKVPPEIQQLREEFATIGLHH